MLTGIHVLLPYMCNYECDHCFLYCSPRASGTFTLAKMKDLIIAWRQGRCSGWTRIDAKGRPSPYLFL